MALNSASSSIRLAIVAASSLARFCNAATPSGFCAATFFSSDGGMECSLARLEGKRASDPEGTSLERAYRCERTAPARRREAAQASSGSTSMPSSPHPLACISLSLQGLPQSESAMSISESPSLSMPSSQTRMPLLGSPVPEFGARKTNFVTDARRTDGSAPSGEEHDVDRSSPPSLPVREPGASDGTAVARGRGGRNDVMRPAKNAHAPIGILRALRASFATGALACLVLAAAPALGATIAAWDVASATGQTVAVLSSAADTSVSIIDSMGVSQWASTAENGFAAASNWAPGLSRDPGKYYQFSVAADPGFEITYQTLDLALFRGIQGANHGAQRWDLYASTNGFASSELWLATFDLSGASADFQTQFLNTDISAVGTQTGTLTFRLFGYDYTSAADYSGLGNDSGWLIYGTGSNVVLGGSVGALSPIPEPATALLAMAGLIGLAVVGRARGGARACLPRR